MWDVTGNGKNHQDDYSRFKKTIQEIVGMSKSKTSEKATKIKKKKQEPQDRSEYLMKQFLELKQFQKGLAAATLDGSNKVNTKKFTKSKDDTESSSGGSECGKGSTSSSSNSRTPINKNYAKERSKREEYNTDELSDTSSSRDSQEVKGYVTEGTLSEESYSDVTSSKYDKEPKVISGLGASCKTQNDSSSVSRIKKKCVLSSSELAIIKDLCRDLIKKKGKPTEDGVQKPELPIMEKKLEELKSDEEVCSKKAELVKTEPKNVKKQEYKTQTEKKENNKYDIKTENTNIQIYNIEPENKKKDKYNPKPENIPNRVNVGLPIYENASTEGTPESGTKQKKIIEITECNDKSIEEITDTLIVKGKLTVISEHKEDTITTDEKFEKVHLEIMTKETVKEVDEWKQSIEEKVVIEKTVKVNVEENEITEKEMEIETKDVVLSNMSDDDLIRKTILEMDQIDHEFMIEKASPNGNENYYNAGIDDGDKMKKKSLQDRVEHLQEQIFSLRAQLDETRRQNEEQAKEVEYLSATMVDQESSLLRSGLDWDEWELREMVRERMEQRRQAAAQDYQERLRVVEALCSAEMGKLEEALQTLVPLNATVSAWDPMPGTADLRSSWQTQDYFFEVITSMNLSSSNENGVSGAISTNGEKPSLTEWKAEGQ